jgi:Zn ribbon nucleic-acid-binding protein
MIINYFSTDFIREEAVCPHCGADLLLRFEGGVLFVLCVHCDFSQIDVPHVHSMRRRAYDSDSRQLSLSFS